MTAERESDTLTGRATAALRSALGNFAPGDRGGPFASYNTAQPLGRARMSHGARDTRHSPFTVRRPRMKTFAAGTALAIALGLASLAQAATHRSG